MAEHQVELPSGYTITDIINMTYDEKMAFWEKYKINPFNPGSLKEIVIDKVVTEVTEGGKTIEEVKEDIALANSLDDASEKEIENQIDEFEQSKLTTDDTTEIHVPGNVTVFPPEFYAAKYNRETESTFVHTNVLHKYASYTYIWTLSALSETEMRNPLLIKTVQAHDIIARSGGIGPDGKYSDEELNVSKFAEHPVHKDAYKSSMEKNARAKAALGESNSILRKGHDIYFEKVVINGIHAPNEDKKLMNYTNIEFELSEPMGVTLYEKLRAAAGNCGYVDHLDAPFLLTLEFVGQDSKGRVHRNAVPKKYWPIKIVDSTVDINQGGSKYTLTAMPWTEFATVNRFNYLRAPITVTGITLKEQIDSFIYGLGNMQETEKEKRVRALNDDYRITYDPYYDGREVQAGNDPVTWWDIGKFSLDEEYQESVFVNPADPTGQHIKSSNIQVPERGSISKTLELMMMRTEAYKNLAEGLMEGNWNKSTAPKSITLGQSVHSNQGNISQEYVPWFKIITTVITHTDQFDNIRKRYKKTIHYHIQPYLVHIGNFVVPGLSGAGQWGKLVKKKYDYIFTGQNLDILDLNINYKYAFFQARLYNDTDAGHDNRQLKKSQEVGETQWFGKGGVYPDANFPLTSEPVLGGSTNSGARESLKHTNNETRQFYDYLTNPLADMIKVNMTIMGDPAWLGHDQALPIAWKSDYDPKNPILVATKVAAPKGFSWSEQESAFNFDEAEPLCTLDFKFPTDFDEKSGFYKLSKQDQAAFSGLYKVVEVDSIFEQGKFSQELLMIRIKNQGGDRKSATVTFEKKKLKKMEFAAGSVAGNTSIDGLLKYEDNWVMSGHPQKEWHIESQPDGLKYNEKVEIEDAPVFMTSGFTKHNHWYTEDENGQRTWHYEPITNNPTKGFY